MAATPPSGARIAALDFVRGVAVLGILLPNMLALGQPYGAGTWPGSFLTPPDAADSWLWAAQLTLVDGKMRGLFTLLFGASLALFLERAQHRRGGTLLQVRRLVWLALFGLLHFFLLWRGDILFGYAVIGLCLLPFARLEAPALLTMAGIGFALGVALDGSAAWALAQGDFSAAVAAERQDDLTEAALVQAGAYAAWVAHTVAVHGWEPLAGLSLLAFETAPLMLLGMGLYRGGLFMPAEKPLVPRPAAWALLAGGAVASLAIALWAVDQRLSYGVAIAAQLGWTTLPRIAMVLGLAVLLAGLGARAGGPLAYALRACGRCAFTNYLGASLAALLLFHGFGGGLYGELGRLELYALAIAGWALMLVWSPWWLARFRYGPLEWLWRCLTYGKLMPLRRGA